MIDGKLSFLHSIFDRQIKDDRKVVRRILLVNTGSVDILGGTISVHAIAIVDVTKNVVERFDSQLDGVQEVLTAGSRIVGG